MSRPPAPAPPAEHAWAVWTVAAVAAFFASLGLIGADAIWLVPLGREIAHGHIPGSIPYATASTSGWHDVPALGQLVFWAAYHAFGGLRGLVVAQTIATAVAFWALARGLSREAADGAVLAVSGVVLVGSAASVIVVGVPLFSLALFPLLLLLLESESRRPSRAIWLAVPLVAVWGNLHGGVLAGWALLACYLVLDRVRRDLLLAAEVLGAATLALFLNPALWHTVDYYRGVFGGEAARRHTELWAHLHAGGVDLLVIVAAAVLLVLTAVGRRRVRLWEWVALAGLVVATIDVARTGTWLLFLAAYPAARALPLSGVPDRITRIAAIVLGAAALALLVRQPADPGSESLARLAANSGQPVLAEAKLGQQIALDGGSVWVNNPIDAFRRSDQRTYLDWLEGNPGGGAAVDHVTYVLVTPGSRAGLLAALNPRLQLVLANPNAILYQVRPTK